MDQTSAVWILIVLSLGTASLPFIVKRPFLALPWRQAGEAERRPWLRWIESLVFFVLLGALIFVAPRIIGQAFFMASDFASAGLFLAKVGGLVAVAVLLLAYPGWRNKGRAVTKSFFDGLLEVLVLYVLIGALGFGFEANIGNPFAQGWEFYAITLSLFVVLAYPGFVYRYLLRHPKVKKG
ncbi:MAG TPA: DUF2818 family protein [Eoetvoesiella sp.]